MKFSRAQITIQVARARAEGHAVGRACEPSTDCPYRVMSCNNFRVQERARRLRKAWMTGWEKGLAEWTEEAGLTDCLDEM